MPSETQDLAAASLERFRSSIATTISQMKGMLADLTGDIDSRNARMQTSLGTFAGGRIDAKRFASLAQNELGVDGGAKPIIERAIAVLEELHGAGDALTQVQLQPGQNLRCLMSRTLRNLGRAFGAARVVDLAKSGAFDEKEHGPLLDAFLYRHWGPSQRALAPMIVVKIEDGDAQATNLGECLDGDLKVVLDFGETCSVAPLARLITPGTFVVQARSAADLATFAAWHGPGAAALVPAGCAEFRHDPAAGNSIAERLQVVSMPESAASRNFGSLSCGQQEQDLEHLHALAAAGAPAGSSEDQAAARPVDKLAALLLQKAHVEEV